MKFTVKLLTCFTLSCLLVASFSLAEARKPQTEAAKALPGNKPVAAKTLPEGFNTMKQWPVKSAETSGTLIFSDSPETVKQDGILYSDVVEGKSRILYYHLNGTTEDKKVVVILENMSADDSFVAITRGGIGGPSEDYLDVGKATQTEYFQAPKLDKIYLAARGKRILDSRMSATVVAPGKLVYGVFDFTTKVPVKLSVVMLPATEDPLTFVSKARVLPADEHRLRGTFAGMDRFVTSDRMYDPQKDGVVYFSLADDKNDLYRIGVDATDGSIVKNYGNYGVLYSIHIPTRGTDKTRYFLKPCGGVYAGVVTARTGWNADKSIIPTPKNKTFFGENAKQMDLADLGVYNNINSMWFEFSPPGASNLPVEFILMPAE